MSTPGFLAKARQHVHRWREPCCALANLGRPFRRCSRRCRQIQTATPIKHVIVIIGENRSFDHVFATYKPKPDRPSPTSLQRDHQSRWNARAQNTLSPHNTAPSNTTVGTALTPSAPPEKTLYSNIPPVVAGGPTRSLHSYPGCCQSD